MASVERTLENALIALIEAITYVSANSIPVKNWDDQSAERVLPCVTVRVMPRHRISPNNPYYRLGVEIVCYRARTKDANQATNDALYDALVDWFYPLTAATLGIDGIVPTESIEELDDSIHYKGIAFDAYETIN